MKRFLTLLTLPALLAGCTAQGSVTGSLPGAGTTGTTSTTGATGTTAAGGSQPGAGKGSGVPISTTGSTRCHTADLSLSIGGGDGAAGSTITNLVFTNRSGRRCTIYGYPGVSWVSGDSGTQINDPFARDGNILKAITLAPGGQAHSSLATHDVGLYSASACKPVQVRGLRVYPPDEKAAVFVSAPQTACSATGVNLGRVRPIASGPADA